MTFKITILVCWNKVSDFIWFVLGISNRRFLGVVLISGRSLHCAPGPGLVLQTQRPDLLSTTKSQPISQHEIHMNPAHKTVLSAEQNLLICRGNCQECCKHMSSNQLKHSIQTKHISQDANRKLVGNHVFKKSVLGSYLHKALKLNELNWITFFFHWKVWKFTIKPYFRFPLFLPFLSPI